MRPNILSRLRNPLLSVGIGGAAITLALLSPQDTGDSPNAAPAQIQTSIYEVPYHVPPAIEPIPKPSDLPTVVKDYKAKVSRSVKRVEPVEQCWDGDISDLNHVPKKNAKQALANIAIACEIVNNEKWYKLHPTQEIDCLVELWDRESGWNEASLNPSSGAGGIPQALPKSKMSSAGKDWRTNPATQIEWGVNYIDARYGTPCDALDAHDNKGWY
jgi:hypothetical protein